MAVIYYDGKKKIHPGGFIGARAVTTEGFESDYRQRYFSQKLYGKKEALRLAGEVDARWRRMADKKLSRRRLYGPKKIINRNTLTGITGLVIVLSVERRKGSLYVAPTMVCQRRVDNVLVASKSLRIHIHGGLRKVWLEMAKFYRDTFELSPKDYTFLRASCPDPKDVTNYLLAKAKERNLTLTKKEVKSWLL